jgi:hypothetical protein
MRLPLLDPGLQPGDEVRCPTCRQWHAVYRRESDAVNKAHPYAQQMLYFTCRAGEYFAGPKLERRTKGGA